MKFPLTSSPALTPGQWITFEIKIPLSICTSWEKDSLPFFLSPRRFSKGVHTTGLKRKIQLLPPGRQKVGPFKFILLPYSYSDALDKPENAKTRQFQKQRMKPPGVHVPFSLVDRFWIERVDLCFTGDINSSGANCVLAPAARWNYMLPTCNLFFFHVFHFARDTPFVCSSNVFCAYGLRLVLRKLFLRADVFKWTLL